MKKALVLSLILVLGVSMAFAALVTGFEYEKFSYAMGLVIYENYTNEDPDQVIGFFKSMYPDLMENFAKEGLQAAIDGNLRYSVEELQQALDDYFDAYEEKQARRAEYNLQVADAFMRINGEREGVVTTASGLQYCVITMGDGVVAKASDRVDVQYELSMLDGRVTDTTGNTFATLVPNSTIAGFKEALTMFPTGSDVFLYIHPSLGYGDADMSFAGIEPNSVLVFRVRILGISGT